MRSGATGLVIALLAAGACTAAPVRDPPSPDRVTCPDQVEAPAAAASTPRPDGRTAAPAAGQAWTAVRPQSGPAAGLVELRAPAGWQRAEGGNAVLFTDGRRSITVEAVPVPDVRAGRLTAALVRDVLLPQAVGGLPGYQLLDVCPVALPAGPGVLATYYLDSATVSPDGRPGRDRVLRYLVEHDAVELALTLTGPADVDDGPIWRVVAESVRWLR